MANTYSITEADLTPLRIGTAEWRDLMVNARDGGTPPSVDEIAEAAAAELHFLVGGAFAAAANLALAKPAAVLISVYRIHAHKAAGSPDYQIPKVVSDDYAMAKDWAQKTGAKLYSAEGHTQPGQANIQHDAPEETFSLTQLDTL